MRGSCKSKTFLFGLAIIILVFSVIPFSSSAEIDSLKSVNLKSGIISPQRGVEKAVEDYIKLRDNNGETHVFIQFDHELSNPEKESLKKEGVKLKGYLGSDTWYASVANRDFSTIKNSNLIGSIDLINENYKKSKNIQNERFGDWAEEGSKVYLEVILHDGISEEKVFSIIRDIGGLIITKSASSDYVLIKIDKDKINSLASHDEVKWIDRPIRGVVDYLDTSRIVVSAESLDDIPYKLDGDGIKIMQYETAVPYDHPDYSSRFETPPYENNADDHATHVAGILVGDGSGDSNLKGIAPKAELIAFELDSSIFLTQIKNEMDYDYDNGIKSGALLSSNSWGENVEDSNCEDAGRYNSLSQLVDEKVRGESDRVISETSFIFAVGNVRQENCGDYNTTTSPSTSKNALSVGAINSYDESIWSGSSWGPTDDGRVKPDLVAPGCTASPGKNGINSTAFGGGYSTIDTNRSADICGTSFAAPHVSGAVALLLQQFESSEPYGIDRPLPSTIKALLIHTAKDLNNTGPDYHTGWGLLNATEAIDYVLYKYFREDSLSSVSEKDQFYFEVNDTNEEVKVTLVWDDEPAQVSDPTPLVNDLDLFLISPNGTVYAAWNLDPSNPSALAVLEGNSVDNVEQVYLPKANQAGRWSINVSAASCPECSQDYSLVYKRPWQSEFYKNKWNLFSIPITPYNASISNVLSGAPEDTLVWERYYDASSGTNKWRYNDVVGGKWGTGAARIHYINHSRGYYLNPDNSDATFEIFGDPVTTTHQVNTTPIELNTSENVVGFNSFFETNINDIKDSLSFTSLETSLQSSDNDYSIFYDHESYDNSDFILKPGEGIQLWGTSSGFWELNQGREAQGPGGFAANSLSETTFNSPFTAYGSAMCSRELNQNDSLVVISIEYNGTELANYTMGQNPVDQYQIHIPHGGTVTTNDTVRVLINGNNISEGDLEIGFSGGFLNFNISVNESTDADSDGFWDTCLDCNSSDANVHPNATESCTDGIDNNCNGLVDCDDVLACGNAAICNDEPETPTDLYCDGVLCANNLNYSYSVDVQCAGSLDNETDLITYVVEAYYNDSGLAWRNIGNHTEELNYTWNISGLVEQQAIDLRCKAVDLNGSTRYSGTYDPNISIGIVDPEVSVSWITPTASSNVTKNDFFKVELNVTCTKSKCGAVNVSLDPIKGADSDKDITTTYTKSSETHCNQNRCTKTLYSGIRFVEEDGEWKKVEDAKSLKNKGFNIEFIEDDPDYELEVIDFNYSHIEIELDSRLGRDTYLRIWERNDTKDQETVKEGKVLKDYYKDSYDKVKDERFEKTDFNKKFVYELGIGNILEFGDNSTTITLNDQDTENLDDSNIYSFSGNGNYGSDASSEIFEMTSYHRYPIFKFNISLGDIIVEDSNFCIHRATSLDTGEYYNFSNRLVYQNYTISGEEWREENITWNNRPTSDYYSAAEDELKLENTYSGGFVYVLSCWNSTELTKKAVSLGYENISLYLLGEDFNTTNNPNGDKTFVYNKEHSDVTERPYLNLTYVLSENATPTFSSVAVNNTLAGKTTEFSILWSDAVALETKGQYIFSTNNSGTWINESEVNFTSTPQWTNITKTLNDTVGMSIGYRWYATNNLSNSTDTGIFVLETDPITQLEIISPKEGSATDISGGETLSVSFNLSKDNVSQTSNVEIEELKIGGTTVDFSSSESEVFRDEFSTETSDKLLDSGSHTPTVGSGWVEAKQTGIPEAYVRHSEDNVQFTSDFNEHVIYTINDSLGSSEYNISLILSEIDTGDDVAILVGRWSNESSTYAVSLSGTASENKLRYINGGSAVTLDTATTGVSGGDDIIFEITDESKRVWKNNVVWMESSDNNVSFNGKPGVGCGDFLGDGGEDCRTDWRLDNFSVVLKAQEGSSYEYGHVGSGEWQVNFTAPNLSSSLKDLFINASHEGDYASKTESNAINYLSDALDKGLISTTIGAVPFYTNASTNPLTTSVLRKGESETIEFWVNTTGNVSDVYKFFAYVNLTNELSVSDMTTILELSIV